VAESALADAALVDLRHPATAAAIARTPLTRLGATAVSIISSMAL